MKKIKLFVLAKGFTMLTTKRRVQELIKNGALEARKASGVWLIDKDSVNARLRSVTKAGGRPRRGHGKSEITFTLMNRTHEVAQLVYSTSRKDFTHMLPYQDEKTGMWHQFINLPNIAPNYLEESGSAIFANAIMKGVRLGVLGERYYQYGRRAFDGICETCLSEHDGQLALDNICLVAGLGNTAHREGTFGYYMSEPIVKNDAKGVAPLVLAYIETMHHDKLAGRHDPLAPSGVCSIEDPFGGYTPGINARKGCE